MAFNTWAIRESLQGFTGKVATGATRHRSITLVDCKLCSSARISTLGWFSGNGLVRAVGVSNYGPKQLVKIHNYLKARGVPLCSAQVQFSLLSMGKDQMEIKDICDSLGIRLIAYSPLGLGMLTGKYTSSNLPLGPRALLFRQILPGLEPLLISLREIAQRRRKTLPQVAINWCICNGAIPIPGVKTIKQVEENLGALGFRLSSDELLQLEYAARESPQKMIQNVFQTR